MKMQKINNCGTCKHYYITWDKSRPYGCLAFGFKSKQLPFIVTKQLSGESCLAYEPKEKK